METLVVKGKGEDLTRKRLEKTSADKEKKMVTEGGETEKEKKARKQFLVKHYKMVAEAVKIRAKMEVDENKKRLEESEHMYLEVAGYIGLGKAFGDAAMTAVILREDIERLNAMWSRLKIDDPDEERTRMWTVTLGEVETENAGEDFNKNVEIAKRRRKGRI